MVKDRYFEPLTGHEESQAFMLGVMMAHTHIAEGAHVPREWVLRGNWPGGNDGTMAETARQLVRLGGGRMGSAGWHELSVQVAGGYSATEWPEPWHYDSLGRVAEGE